jgi:hypothetical protein
MERQPASVWQLEVLRTAARKRGMDTIAFHQCEYGADYPKPTRFLSDAKGLLQLGFGVGPSLTKTSTTSAPCLDHVDTPISL